MGSIMALEEIIAHEKNQHHGTIGKIDYQYSLSSRQTLKSHHLKNACKPTELKQAYM